ncbi:MAG: hypothetical protein WAM97_19565, partial [Acidimicrobiales bacterium]
MKVRTSPPSLRVPKSLGILAVIVAFAALLAACGSSSPKSDPTSTSNTTSSSGSTSSTSAPSTSTSTTGPHYSATGPSVSTIDSAKSVTVGGKTVTVPIDSGKPAEPGIDSGQQIVISESGFLPSKLYSTPGDPIVWTNLTNQPQQVKFDYFAVQSPVIPPGGTW